MTPKKLAIVGAALALAAALVWLSPWPSRQKFRPDPVLGAALDGVTRDYRTIIVLVDGSETLDAETRARAITAGRILFWRKHEALDEITRILTRSGADGIRQLLQYLSANPGLHDADKLAFLDLVDELASAIPANGSKRNPLADPIRAARDNLQSIQLAYREEVTRIFSQFATRGGSGTREKWDAYVANLRKTISREKALAEFGDIPEEPAEDMRGGGTEIFGSDFAPKSVALTFDDGPHPRYTEQVLALLRKYGIRACFFELGVNLGVVQDAGEVKLSPTAEISKKVLEAGHVIANHTYSHRVLPKLSEQERASEIDRTDLLIQKVTGNKPILFRAPYGARNKDILNQVATDGLRSVMWTIDSLDWADPVPESIAMRVLHELNQKQKGIILFHDIHKQSVMALAPVIEELQRQEYNFLSFENGQFVKPAAPAAVQRSSDAGRLRHRRLARENRASTARVGW